MLIAVLLSTLSPAISQAFPIHGTPNPFIVSLCSAEGKKRIEAAIVGGKAETQPQIPSQKNVGTRVGHCSTGCAGHISTLVTLAKYANLFLICASIHQSTVFYTPPRTTRFFQSANLAQAPPQSVSI